MPFCTELIARAEAGEDPLKIAQDARGRVFEQWGSIDTAPAAERLAWAQDAAFAAGLNSVELELREADVAAARKGHNSPTKVAKKERADRRRGDGSVCRAKDPLRCRFHGPLLRKAQAEAPKPPAYPMGYRESVAKVKQMTAQEADDALRPEAGRIWRGCTDEEKDALVAYTADSTNINWRLRGRGDDMDAAESALADRQGKLIADVLERTSLPQDVVVTRGSGRFDYLDDLLEINGKPITKETVAMLNKEKIGRGLSDKAFLSTGLGHGSGFKDKEVQFHILARKRSKALYVEPFAAKGKGFKRSWDGRKKQKRFSDEDELLLMKDGTLSFKGFRLSENNKLIIDCELIQ